MRSFINLVCIALGVLDEFPNDISDNQWEMLFEMSEKQAIIGLCYSGIERLPEKQRPPKELLLQWFMLSHQIEETNKILNKRCYDVWSYYAQRGYYSCILKGQGNASLYPNPLKRQSGDIDVWLVPVDSNMEDWDKNRKAILCDIISDTDLKRSNVHYSHLHVNSTKWDDVVVEVHFYPSYLKDPFSNRYLRNFYINEFKRQSGIFVGLNENGLSKIMIPNWRFNVVFQLTHIFDHFITEGVGLRQIIDYYYLLLSHEVTEEEKAYLQKVLRKIHLYGFAGAVSWILVNKFKLNDKYLIIEPNINKGLVLFDEIMQGGNLGQYESRYWKHGDSKIIRYYHKTRRLMRFVRSYPYETLWEPYYRIRKLYVETKLSYSVIK